MSKIYIAGKVKDLPPNEVKQKFALAAQQIKEAGHNAINPVEFIEQYNEHIKLSGGVPLSDNDEQQRREILKMCTDLLMDCDKIYLLHDWQQSAGATFEKQVADFFKIPVYHA